MTLKTIRRSLVMTPEMHDRLQQLLSKQGREVTESDLIREAIRRFLDEQETLIGSRRHFQKTLQDRIDLLEHALSFHLNLIDSMKLKYNRRCYLYQRGTNHGSHSKPIQS